MVVIYFTDHHNKETNREGKDQKNIENIGYIKILLWLY